jgi:hypothetical protein
LADDDSASEEVIDDPNESEGAEEVDGEDAITEAGELSKDDIESIGNMLSKIRATQYAEHLAMVAQLEAEGEKMSGQETPDDYEFAGH